MRIASICFCFIKVMSCEFNAKSRIYPYYFVKMPGSSPFCSSVTEELSNILLNNSGKISAATLCSTKHKVRSVLGTYLYQNIPELVLNLARKPIFKCYVNSGPKVNNVVILTLPHSHGDPTLVSSPIVLCRIYQHYYIFR